MIPQSNLIQKSGILTMGEHTIAKGAEKERKSL
jgi:hypothetical protein